jgi:hypothetical protein
MTETDWLSCNTRPADMLRQVRNTAPARKLQLLGCACCRLVWEDVPAVGATPVSALERHLDGSADAPDLLAARDELLNVYRGAISDGIPDTPEFAGLLAAYTLTLEVPTGGCEGCIAWVQEAASRAASDGEKQAALNRIRQQICDLFREVIGNPFRPWKVIPDSYVGGGGVVQPDGKTVRLTDTARRLAEGIRADQGFDRLPILADALEEAGVTDAEMLAHCRRDGGHVRGCWALDVVLGKA